MTEPAPGAKVTLRRVTGKTVRAICDLKVSDSQKALVTANAISIAEAYFTKHAWFRAIYAGDTPVGFVMLYEDTKRGAYSLWRFMIDARYQGRGYGRKALDLVLERVRNRPRAKTLTLHVVRAEGGAEALYQQYGFYFTGKIEGGQHVMKLKL